MDTRWKICNYTEVNFYADQNSQQIVSNSDYMQKSVRNRGNVRVLGSTTLDIIWLRTTSNR